jgi:hypothetical protein
MAGDIDFLEIYQYHKWDGDDAKMGDQAVLIPYLFVCCLGFAGNVCTTGQILH